MLQDGGNGPTTLGLFHGPDQFGVCLWIVCFWNRKGMKSRLFANTTQGTHKGRIGVAVVVVLFIRRCIVDGAVGGGGRVVVV